MLNFACSSFNPSIGTSVVSFNWYQVLNLFPCSSIAFVSQLVLRILLLLNSWRSILRFVSNFLLTPFFILMIALSTRGRKFWHKDGSYKRERILVLLSLFVLSTHFCSSNELCFLNHLFVPFVLSIHSSRGRLRNQVLWFDL